MISDGTFQQAGHMMVLVGLASRMTDGPHVQNSVVNGCC